MKRILAIACLALLATAPTAFARETRVEQSLQELLNSQEAKDAGIDGSVKFYLAGQSHPAVAETFGNDSSNRKTNAFGKSDAEACRWVTLSVLKALQDGARVRGANAVIDMASFYNGKEFTSPANYECYAGAIMAGMALKGTYAKLK